MKVLKLLAALMAAAVLAGCDQPVGSNGGGINEDQGVGVISEGVMPEDGARYVLQRDVSTINGIEVTTLSYTAKRDTDGFGYGLLVMISTQGGISQYQIGAVLGRQTESFSKSDYDTFIIQTDSSDYVIVDNNVTSVTSSESLPYMFVIEGSLGNYEISQIASGENVKVYVGKSGTDNGGYFLVPDDFITLIRQNM